MTRTAKIFIIATLLFWGIIPARAEDSDKLVGLTKQIMETKNNQDLYAPFRELQGLYFKEHKYTEFVEFLKSLALKKNTLEPFTSYYIALARYAQLKYWEENQVWDEYFALGNAYRDELTKQAQKAVDSAAAADKLNVYARLLLFQFHQDQQDSFAEQALTDLMNSAVAYSTSADAQPIKEVADKLFASKELAKSRELYKIYTEKLVTSDIKDEELANTANNFLQDGNLELAESIYDIYLERISKTLAKEKLIPLLIDLAKDFAYQDDQTNDPPYAEKIFAKIEEAGGKNAFDEELIYLRAFNLEKYKEYAKAKDNYLDLINAFPKGVHAEEALFKTGVIYAYVLRDRKVAKTYFEKLVKPEGSLSPQGISGLYQLGLFCQWENDSESAKNYYNKLITAAGDGFTEKVTQAKQRLKEIEEAKPMEYNLKTFLDVTFAQDYAALDMGKINLKSHPYKAKKDEQVSVNSSVYVGDTGCMQMDLQYLWSGDLGKLAPSSAQSSFNTSFESSGTKEINLVVISPSGIIDRAIDLLDVE